jgi:hypothetical protein
MNNTHPWTTMKPWHAIIAMVGILILVSAPVVANPIPFDLFEPGFGTLSINSDPSGANVYLDGQYQGTTPLTISGLSGPHGYNIALTMQGYRTYFTSVYISNGKTSTVSATLTPVQILPSGYGWLAHSSQSSKYLQYLPTPTPPFIPSGRSAVDVYFWLKALGNLPVM